MLRMVIRLMQSVEEQQSAAQLGVRSSLVTELHGCAASPHGCSRTELATHVCTSRALRAWAQEIVMTHQPVNSPPEAAGNTAAEGLPQDVISAELDVRRALAFRLGTTTRSTLDEAVSLLRGKIVAFADEVFAVEADLTSSDRSFRLEVTHLVDNPPRRAAYSHEVYAHVRAQARVLRKLVAMKRQPQEPPVGATADRPPLPIRPRPSRPPEFTERTGTYVVPSGLASPFPEGDG
ncbi:hypothetical protein [Streptomyces sp. EN23]|uniref:hypothetical protein n=1 Tax=Streptomyces sp. EN23 TaxID=212774 RepID=UPI00159F153B|nr:hypothetical protein [Streptomyces sp. EN23]